MGRKRGRKRKVDKVLEELVQAQMRKATLLAGQSPIKPDASKNILETANFPLNIYIYIYIYIYILYYIQCFI